MIGYPAGSESSDDVEVSSGGELEPLLTLAFSKSGSLGDEGSKNSGIDQRCSLLAPAGMRARARAAQWAQRSGVSAPD